MSIGGVISGVADALAIADPQTRTFTIRIMVVTVALSGLGTLGTALYLAVNNRTVPGWVLAFIAVVIGNGASSFSAHLGATTATNAAAVTAGMAVTNSPPPGPPIVKVGG